MIRTLKILYRGCSSHCCNAVWFGESSEFFRDLTPPFAESKNGPGKKADV
jgi:hypothetical protein